MALQLASILLGVDYLPKAGIPQKLPDSDGQIFGSANIILIGEAMRIVEGCPLQAQLLSQPVHLVQKLRQIQPIVFAIL